MNTGPYYGPYTAHFAFIYRAGQSYNLNNFIPAHPGVVLTDAVAINDIGMIVASYSASDKESSSYYLLVPSSPEFPAMR